MRTATAHASATASTQFHPCRTNSTPTIAPEKPLTEPTDRSISPTKSTHTMPSEMMPTAHESRARFTRLALDKNTGLSDWKIVQMTISPTTTGSTPTSPALTLRQNDRSVPPRLLSTSSLSSPWSRAGFVCVVVMLTPHRLLGRYECGRVVA